MTRKRQATGDPPGHEGDEGGGFPESGRVLVAMSGGVDSSVAALLLKVRGLHVLGVTFRLYPDQEAHPASVASRAWAAPVERARQVCKGLGISHQVIDLTEAFRRMVIDPFCGQYAAGATPNPCVRCNALVKWPGMIETAAALDCAYVATGHYARIRSAPGRYRILRGADRRKDQSYALYSLPQAALARTLLPLGSMTKELVRKTAERASLPTSSAGESQDICFIPHGDYRGFLAPRISARPGPIQDAQGRLLGTHKGLPFYTVGQRKGLGIAAGRPLYVIEKDTENNRLVVGHREALCRRAFRVTGVNWVSMACPPAETVLEAEVEVRYRSKAIPGQIHVEGNDMVGIQVPDHHQAVAPGQSAVWYGGDVLLGGGIIQGPGVRDQGSGPS